jgi:hypothetical protein
MKLTYRHGDHRFELKYYLTLELQVPVARPALI